ncbi:Flp family type IVb pilin [Comamonas thiooxydans]|uniref:Flp family type IVb pilin n=1 Tax=Comamonas thiooxydans TaxID=363952 RepID=UPI00244B5F65|nr:Flp family type IVb pilin [Comamonas thiooxydans]MDH1473357.1 Flp family type IVb pilin [Comamonas thiooxydans]
MNSIAQQFGHSLQSFVQDEEGAQIIEYALVVAVVSIGLIVLMKSSISNTLFTDWLTKVKACLTNTNCT